MRDSLLAVQYKNNAPWGLVILTCEYREEEGKWLAECLELGTVTYAPSLEEVQKELLDAILLQLNEVEKLGYNDEYLREHGVRIYKITRPNRPSRTRLPWAAPIPVGA